jgi:hypothetical protein
MGGASEDATPQRGQYNCCVTFRPFLTHINCMSSEHFGQLAWQFKRMSGSSGGPGQARRQLCACELITVGVGVLSNRYFCSRTPADRI